MAAGLTDAELTIILADATKRIEGDIVWALDEDHSPALRFRREVRSDWSLFVAGRYSPPAGKLTYALILRGVGRVYGLDIGTDHHNPTCERVGDVHVHRWSEAHGTDFATVPHGIKDSVSDTCGVWRRFCRMAGIDHAGHMRDPSV